MYENIPVPAHAAKPAHTFETFQKQMIATLAALVSAGAINQDYIETLKRFFGVKEIWEVSKNEAQAREMFENFCLSGLITKVG
jgi:adenosine deaminase